MHLTQLDELNAMVYTAVDEVEFFLRDLTSPKVKIRHVHISKTTGPTGLKIAYFASFFWPYFWGFWLKISPSEG